MKEKLIDIITVGVIIYTCITIFSLYKNHNNIVKKLLENYKTRQIEVQIGIFLIVIIIIANIYYNNKYDKLDESMQKKTKKLYDSTIAGIIALLIAWLAYLDKILPAFFLIFVVHYYFSINE
jgi:uncharacterized protein YacL